MTFEFILKTRVLVENHVWRGVEANYIWHLELSLDLVHLSSRTLVPGLDNFLMQVFVLLAIDFVLVQ